MIFLTPLQAKQRLENESNLAIIIHFNTGGCNIGRPGIHNPHMTAAEKALVVGVGLENKLNGITYEDTAKAFGISARTIQNGIRGANSNQNQTNSPNTESTITKPEVIQELVKGKAVDKLISALDLLTIDKISESETANDIASVAVKMATVHEKMSVGSNNGKGITINIHPPKVMQESHYECITVTE